MLTSLLKIPLPLVLRMKSQPLTMAFLDQTYGFIQHFLLLFTQVPSTKQKCFHSFRQSRPFLLLNSVKVVLQVNCTLILWLDNSPLPVLQAAAHPTLHVRGCSGLMRCMPCQLFCNTIPFTLYKYLFSTNLLHQITNVMKEETILSYLSSLVPNIVSIK